METLNDNTSNRILLFLKILFGFVFLLKSLESLYPFGHGDALYYNLPLAKIWIEKSLGFAYENLCNGLMTGYFDLLYYFPIKLFGATLNGHRFSQFMHFFFSIGLGSLIIFSYFRKKNLKLAFLGGISCLTFGISSDFFLYAKNDGVMALVSLVTSIIVIDDKYLPKISHLKRSILIGVGLGLVPAIKLNGIFLTIPLSLYYTYKNRKNIKAVVLTAFIAFAVITPLLIRNYYYLDNPFFPGLVSLFPGEMGPEMLHAYTTFMSNPLSISGFLGNLKTFFMAKAIFLLIPILIFKNVDLSKKIAPYLLVSASFLILILIVNGGIDFPRFIFPCFFLNLVFLLKFFESSEIIHTKWIYLAIILVLIDSKIDKSLRRIFKLPNTFTQNENFFVRKMSQNTQFWDFIERKKILSDDYNEMFYSPSNTILHASNCNLQLRFLNSCTSSDFKKLKEYEYAILNKNKKNFCYNKILSQPVIHQVGDYKLYDLRNL